MIFAYVLLNIARLRRKPGLNLRNCLYLGQFISILLFEIYQAPTYRKILPERDYAVTKAKGSLRPYARKNYATVEIHLKKEEGHKSAYSLS